MEAIKALAVGFLTSKKFVTMVTAQVLLYVVYLCTKLPEGLQGLALTEVQLVQLNEYVTNATVVVVGWLLSQGVADMGKWKNS